MPSRFADMYGAPPDVAVRSPGRVNLIGDHTDYNDGFVMPFAIDRQVHMAARIRPDSTVVAHSDADPAVVSFDLSDYAHGGPPWGEYLKGVAWAHGYDGPGLELLIESDIPLGAGLSSSAALELAMARTIALASESSWEPIEAAKACQFAENDWVGTACGIMDQLVVANASRGAALLIDCRSLEMRPYPLPGTGVLAVLDTRTRRSLLASGYNDRREGCERAAAAYGVPALRDVTEEGSLVRPEALSEGDWRLARHVVSENGRVIRAAEALAEGDLDLVGRLMIESHVSLRDLFEVTNLELDLMMRLAVDQPGCYGARMTGGGFGGCVVALLSQHDASDVLERTLGQYREMTGLVGDALVLRAVAGTSVAS